MRECLGHNGYRFSNCSARSVIYQFSNIRNWPIYFGLSARLLLQRKPPLMNCSGTTPSAPDIPLFPPSKTTMIGTHVLNYSTFKNFYSQGKKDEYPHPSIRSTVRTVQNVSRPHVHLASPTSALGNRTHAPTNRKRRDGV